MTEYLVVLEFTDKNQIKGKAAEYWTCDRLTVEEMLDGLEKLMKANHWKAAIPVFVWKVE